MYKVLVTLPVEERHKLKLESAGKNCAFSYVPRAAVTEEEAQDADIIIGNAPASKIAASKKLKWLQLNTAGADEYIKPGALDEGTILTNATGAYGKSVGEHTFAALLMLQKKLHLYRDAQSRSEWTDAGPVTSVSDLTVAIIGLGDIGLYIARLFKALGAYVIGVKRRPSACPEGVDELYTTEQIEEVLPRADAVISILPGTEETYHFYTRERFKLMKKSAIFLNSGRGSAVDSQVLYDALTEGDIAAAAIDVTEPEPLSPDSPLWRLENLLITPHISGGFHLQETFERIVDIAAENLAAFTEGRELMNLVDFTTGYKR